MSAGTPRTQGMPLVFLGVILGSWITARTVTWHGTEAAAATSPAREAHVAAVSPPAIVPVAAQRLAMALDTAHALRPTIAVAMLERNGTAAVERPIAIHRRRSAPPNPPFAMIEQMPSPVARAAPLIAAPPAAPLWPEKVRRPDRPQAPGRWSGDAWLLLRSGSAAPLGAGFAAPAYGASQAGAVIRYRLGIAATHRPALYLRATGAVVSGGEREAALGLTLRPVPQLPVAALAEVRVTHAAGAVRTRPAVALVSQFAPLTLPGKVSLEVYGQGGWVGGTAATAFVDGQARATRSLAERGGLRLAVGAGAWGGAQRGAARADLGPTAVLAIPLGRGSARLAADWRFRVAGNAAPGSGPALTLSAGF